MDSHAENGPRLDLLNTLAGAGVVNGVHGVSIDLGNRLFDSVAPLHAIVSRARVLAPDIGSSLARIERSLLLDGPLSLGKLVERIPSGLSASALRGDAPRRTSATIGVGQSWSSAGEAAAGAVLLGLVLVLATVWRRSHISETPRTAREREVRCATAGALDGHRAKLRQAALLTRVSCWELVAPFREIELGERMQELFGFPSTAALSELVERIHPADRTKARDAFLESTTRGTPLHLELRLTAQGGEPVALRISAETRMGDDGNVDAIFGACQEITEPNEPPRTQGEARAQLRAFFDGSSDVLLLTDAEFRVIEFNEAAAEYARAFANVVLAEGLFIGDVFESTFGRDAGIRAARALSGERVTIQRELKDSSGSNHWFEVSYTPVQVDGGRLHGMAFAVRDITERRGVETQLLHAQKMESLGRLAGGVAHDFNNLLTAIIGYSNLAAAGVDEGSAVREDIEQAVAAAMKAAALTRQLLVFARQRPADAEDLDINVLTGDLEKMLRRLIGEHVELVCSLTPDQLVSHVNRSQLEQVLVNLVVNARDAMTAGGRLTIETHPVWLDGEYCSRHPEVNAGPYSLLAVTDNGSGIPEEILPHIFDPFFTTKEQGKGTGLGLATCYGIVKQAGGHIAVYTEPGRGTSFKVYLPRLTTDAAVQRREAEPLPQDRGTGVVLLVEDQDEVRALAERVLTAQGYTVVVAPGPLQAIELAAQRPRIDLIVSDLIMPDMDGLKMVDILREMIGPRPVLLMSGYAEESVLSGLAARDDVSFVSKPITSRELTARAAEVLAGASRYVGDAGCAI